jgi:thiol-disulfide isomerase/thioredoxin
MWCGYCRIAASTIQETQDRYADQGFYYVTILVEDYDGSTVEQSDLQSWATSAGITTAPVLAADMSMMDPSGESGWPVTSWPTFVVIDKEMTIYYGQRGWNEAAIEAAIQGALAE